MAQRDPGVVPDGVGVELVLRDADHFQQFRRELRQQAAVFQQFQAEWRAGRHQGLAELVADALKGDHARPVGVDVVQPCGALAHGLPGDRVDRKPEAGGEADSAQHPQAVVLERQQRVGRRPQDFGLQVGVGQAERVRDRARVQVFEQRVNGEVAPLGIVLKRPRFDIRLAAIRRIGLDTGRH